MKMLHGFLENPQGTLFDEAIILNLTKSLNYIFGLKMLLEKTHRKQIPRRQQSSSSVLFHPKIPDRI